MQLVSNMMHQEAAMGAAMVGYFLYYYETWILPTLLRQEKHRCGAPAGARAAA